MNRDLLLYLVHRFLCDLQISCPVVKVFLQQLFKLLSIDIETGVIVLDRACEVACHRILVVLLNCQLLLDCRKPFDNFDNVVVNFGLDRLELPDDVLCVIEERDWNVLTDDIG